MARITTKRPDEDEEELIEDENDVDEEEGIAAPATPAVSDSRRRRMLKRGELPVAQADTDDAPSGLTPRKDRPTPSRSGEIVRSNNVVVRFVQDIRTYFKETWDELQKVTWLSREENIRLTYIVLVVTAASAAFLGLVSFLYGLLTQALASSTSGLAAGVVVIVMIIAVAGGWLMRDRLFPPHYE